MHPTTGELKDSSDASSPCTAATSFCSPHDVDACFVMVMGNGGSHDSVEQLQRHRLTAERPLLIFVATERQAQSAGEALNELARIAAVEGFTHAVVAASNERLVRRTGAGADDDDGVHSVGRLPADWQTCDVLQIATNAKNRPLADVLVRLAAVRFHGTLLPAPIPISREGAAGALVVRPWNDCVLDIEERLLTHKQLHAAVNVMWECLSSLPPPSSPDLRAAEDYRRFELTLFTAMLPELSVDADMLLDDRLKQGDDGWGGADGMYFAARLAASTAIAGPRALQTYLLAAEIGLEQTPPRVEALHALATYLRKTTNSPNVAGLLAAASAGCSAVDAPAAWMGDATSALYGIRDEVGVAGYGMLSGAVRDRVSYPNLLACADVPAAAFEPRVRDNYGYVARPGDACAARRSCPGPVDALLPAVVVHDNFAVGVSCTDGADAFWKNAERDEPRGTRWAWLLTLYGNAVGALAGLEWDDPPSKLDVSAGSTTATFCAPKGYVFVLAIPSPGFGRVGALELVRHAATGWTGTPCAADVTTEAEVKAAHQLRFDAAACPAAWVPCSMIEVPHGRLIAVRAGLFYRFTCTGGAAGGASFLIANTRLACGNL